MHQKVELIGRLGADPQVKIMQDGGMVANLRIATDESYRDKAGEKVKKTEWHRVVLFSRLAEVANDYLKTGRLVFVEGKIKTRKYTDKENIERYTTEIIGAKLRMLDSVKGKDLSDEAVDAPQTEIHEDNVPF